MKATRSGCGVRWLQHAGVTEKHKKDVLVAKERAQIQFVPVSIPRRDRHIDRPKLGTLTTFLVLPDGAARPCTEREWEKGMTYILRHRRWYRDDNQKKQYKHPIVACLVTIAPHWSDVLTAEAEGNTPRIIKFLAMLVQLLVELFAKETGREVIGVASHFDSRCIHFDIATTRISTDMRLLGQKALGMVGPDVIGILRQIKYNIINADCEEARVARGRLNREVERGWKRGDGERHGVMATDWKLSEAVDEACEKEFGRSVFVKPALEAYKLEASITPKLRSLAAFRRGLDRKIVEELVNVAGRTPGARIPREMLPGIGTPISESERHMLKKLVIAEEGLAAANLSSDGERLNAAATDSADSPVEMAVGPGSVGLGMTRDVDTDGLARSANASEPPGLE